MNDIDRLIYLIFMLGGREREIDGANYRERMRERSGEEGRVKERENGSETKNTV